MQTGSNTGGRISVSTEGRRPTGCGCERTGCGCERNAPVHSLEGVDPLDGGAEAVRCCRGPGCGQLRPGLWSAAAEALGACVEAAAASVRRDLQPRSCWTRILLLYL